MVIAIDGPSGAGKSSVAKLLAKKLEMVYVDTGALYRTVGLYVYNKGIEKSENEKIISCLNGINLEIIFENGTQQVLLNGVNVGDTIRTQNIASYASAVSAIPEVRTFLLDTQRNIAKKSDVIMDGRDIGTVIFPNADVKIFLTASDVSRAERRLAELIEKGEETTLEKVLEQMRERDKNDSTRATAPAIPADDAVMLDNSELDLNGTAEVIIEIVNEKTGK